MRAKSFTQVPRMGKLGKRLARAWTRSNVARFLITRLARAGHPRAVALLIGPMLRTMYTPFRCKTAAPYDSPYRVMMLPKDGFTQDALAILRATDMIEVVALPRACLKALANAFLPAEVGDNNYASASPAAQAAMQRYRAFLTRFWQSFDPHRRIGAVLTGNFGYHAERELGAALEDLGVPFVALHKENTKGPGGQTTWERVYKERRGPFRGRRLLVYNPVERDLMVRAGVVEPERIEVIGMPRLDEVHKWHETHVGEVPEATVLFASFSPQTAMPFIKRGRGQEKYKELFDETACNISLWELCRSVHRAALDLALSSPEITVVIKAKGRAGDRPRILSLLEVSDERDLPKNLRVVYGGSPFSLLVRAAVVCGFNTTLLLEALAAGRPVVVPSYAEAIKPEILPYIFDPGDAVQSATSPGELVDRLRRLALERRPVPNELDARAKKILYEWLGNDDGAAGERAATAILRILQNGSPHSTDHLDQDGPAL